MCPFLCVSKRLWQVEIGFETLRNRFKDLYSLRSDAHLMKEHMGHQNLMYTISHLQEMGIVVCKMTSFRDCESSIQMLADPEEIRIGLYQELTDDSVCIHSSGMRKAPPLFPDDGDVAYQAPQSFKLAQRFLE